MSCVLVLKRKVKIFKDRCVVIPTLRTMNFSSVTKNAWLKGVLVVVFLLVNVLLYKEGKEILSQALSYRHSVFHLDRTVSIGGIITNFTIRTTPFRDLVHLTNTSESHSSNLTVTLPSSPVLLPSDATRLQYLLTEEIVNPHDFQYVIQPNVSCLNRHVRLVICVPISRKNALGRETVRDTWGSYAYNKSNNAVLIFFIGAGANKSGDEQRSLEKEAEKYGDLLQEDYIDTYGNLSLKSVSILKWVTTFCPNTQFVLKADDDMYVNIPNLMHSLEKITPDLSHPSAFIMGSAVINAAPQRQKTSKWYTPEGQYKDKKYPRYVSGTAYAMTSQGVLLLYHASLRVPLFWLEDIYITGLCSKKAGVTVHNNPLLTYGKPKVSGCSFRTQISGHRYTPAEIQTIHSELYHSGLRC